jgi:hypothetical protein
VVFGLALSVTSTVVLIRALENRGLLDPVNGHPGRRPSSPLKSAGAGIGNGEPAGRVQRAPAARFLRAGAFEVNAQERPCFVD